MKQSRPHVVPLSIQALAVLEEAKGLAGDSPYVFAGAHMGKHISDNTFGKLARHLPLAAIPTASGLVSAIGPAATNDAAAMG